MTTTQRPALPGPEQELGLLLDAIDDLAGLAGDGHLGEQGLESLARRCRAALAADIVLIAVRHAGRPEVVSDEAADLASVELRRQTVLAQASLDDPVIDHPPGLPRADQGHRPPTVVDHPLRRLVTELPRRDHLCGTLTVCRRLPFEADEVELAMAFAGLAALVMAQAGRPIGAAVEPHERPDAVGRLFAVGIALHLMLRWAEDAGVRRMVEEAMDQLDLAILDIRRAAWTGHLAR